MSIIKKYYSVLPTYYTIFFQPSFDAELKTSPTIHEQKQKLERAKMGDLLKAKIQQRPDRQELVRQHILEGNYNFRLEKKNSRQSIGDE